MNDPFPPKILVTQGAQDDGLPLLIRPATFVGMHAGLPAYHIDPPPATAERLEKEPYVVTARVFTLLRKPNRSEPPEDRLTTDTTRALDLIGKALEPESGSLS